ncbi:MAG: hypothetical protein HKN14_08730 [Marinicaulis sp.]|nr:hypothetical protein [Marinicaulis sp.]
METSRKVKMSVMAASALVAAAGALAPASASDFDTAAYPAVVEAPLVAHATDHADKYVAGKSGETAKRFAFVAVAAGALAGLIRVLGFKRVARVIRRYATRTVKVSANAAGGAVRVVGRVVRSPLQYLGIMAGFVLVAMTGVGLYDVEWIAGLAVGAAAMGVVAFAAMKSRLQLRPARPDKANSGAGPSDRVNRI